MSIRVINGLKDLNGDFKRDNVSKDKSFIKALLVGLIGVTAIKNGDVDKYVMRFIKGELKFSVLKFNFFRSAVYLYQHI